MMERRDKLLKQKERSCKKHMPGGVMLREPRQRKEAGKIAAKECVEQIFISPRLLVADKMSNEIGMQKHHDSLKGGE